MEDTCVLAVIEFELLHEDAGALRHRVCRMDRSPSPSFPDVCFCLLLLCPALRDLCMKASTVTHLLARISQSMAEMHGFALQQCYQVSLRRLMCD